MDDLLRPVLVDRAPPATPWHLGMQAYVGLLGGPLALSAIATANARKLRQSAAVQAAIAAVGIALEVALIVLTELSGLAAAGLLPNALAGLITYGFARRLQLSGDRVYRYRTGGNPPYASLVVPGLVAIVLADLVTVAIWMPS